MLCLGTVPSGSTLYIPFTTYGKTNGESITMTGLAVTDIEIYKNGSVTQRSSDAGYTLLDTDGIDFDGITGLHGFSIDLSDNTDASFYAVGSWYWVVVSAVTVDSQTVTFCAAVFRIGPAESVTGYSKADVSHFGGTAGTFASGRPEVNTSHVAGTAQTAGDLKASLNTIDDFIDTEIADIQARLPAALTADGNIKADTLRVGGTLQTAGDLVTLLNAIDDYLDTEIAAIKTKTDFLPSATAGTNGGLPTVDASNYIAGIQSAGSLNQLDDLNNLSAAGVNAEVVDVINTDTSAEPGQEAPGATVSLRKKVDYLYKAWRNKKEQTATTWSLYDDAGTTVDQKSTVSDDGTTATKGEVASGP